MIFNLFERVIQYLKNYRADFWYLFLLQNGGRSCIVPKFNYFFANFWHVKLNNLKNNADIHNSFCNFLDITLLHNSWKFQDERMNGSGDFLRAVNPVFAKFAFWEKGLLVKQVPFSLIFHKELFAIHSLCHNSAKNALIFSIFFFIHTRKFQGIDLRYLQDWKVNQNMPKYMFKLGLICCNSEKNTGFCAFCLLLSVVKNLRINNLLRKKHYPEFCLL